MLFCLLHIAWYLPYILPWFYRFFHVSSACNFFSWNIKFFKKGNCQPMIQIAASNSFFFFNFKFRESFPWNHPSHYLLIWFSPSGTLKRMHKLYCFKFEIQRVFFLVWCKSVNSENHLHEIILVIIYCVVFYRVVH